MTITRRERRLLRVLATLIVFSAVLNFIAGCAVVKDKIGGQVFAVSATLAGVTVGVQGTIPVNEAPAP